MTAMLRGYIGLPLKTMALVVGLWGMPQSSTLAQDYPPPGSDQTPNDHNWHKLPADHDGPGSGTLGYGPPGLYPGFQGFGLGYHLGYGFGGDALGVGALGGYPFYGGPGYPHPWPRLQRLGGIRPFPYYGGPGYPTPASPNSFGEVGGLIPDRPVITILSDPRAPAAPTSYGSITGAIPNAEEMFARSTVHAGAGASSLRPGSSSVPANPAPPRRGNSIDTPTRCVP
jgi:hypothetical protein